MPVYNGPYLPYQTPWYGNHPSNRLQTPPFASIAPSFNSVKTVVPSCQVNPISADNSTAPQNVSIDLPFDNRKYAALTFQDDIRASK